MISASEGYAVPTSRYSGRGDLDRVATGGVTTGNPRRLATAKNSQSSHHHSAHEALGDPQNLGAF